jgi:LacI family transcriptional regulator
VAVVSCDDMPFAEYLTPSLSSLRVPFAETGQEAVELLLRSIAGEPAPESTVRLPVELIVRDSCGGRPAPATPVAFSPVIPPPSASPAHREKQEDS